MNKKVIDGYRRHQTSSYVERHRNRYRARPLFIG